MLSKNVTIDLPPQKDASCAAKLVQTACNYQSSIYLYDNDRKVNAKSIMGMMNLAIIPGKTLLVTAQGSDEQQALDEIEAFLTASRSK